MEVRGKLLGTGIILVLIIIGALAVSYDRHLEQQRTQAIAQLVSLPAYQDCRYDETVCPQAVDTVALPDAAAMGLLILGILLGIYLIRSDHTHRSILEELHDRRASLVKDERRDLLYSVLTPDERKVVEAVRQQAGISQATLRLRTDMSKAQLSVTLKELERRGILKRIEDGKTNAVHLKREI